MIVWSNIVVSSHLKMIIKAIEKSINDLINQDSFMKLSTLLNFKMLCYLKSLYINRECVDYIDLNKTCPKIFNVISTQSTLKLQQHFNLNSFTFLTLYISSNLQFQAISIFFFYLKYSYFYILLI